MYSYRLVSETRQGSQIPEYNSGTYQLNQDALKGIYSHILLLNVSSSMYRDELKLQTNNQLSLPFVFADEQFISRSSEGLEILSEDIDKWFDCPLAYPLLFGKVKTQVNEFPPHVYYYDADGSILHGDKNSHPKLSIGITEDCKSTIVVSIPTPISLDSLSDFLSGFLLFDSILYRYNVIDLPGRFNLYIRNENNNIILTAPISPISGMNINSLSENLLRRILMDRTNATICKKFYFLMSEAHIRSRIQRFNELAVKTDLSQEEIEELTDCLKGINMEAIHDIHLEQITNPLAISILIELLAAVDAQETVLELTGINIKLLLEIIKLPSYLSLNKESAISVLLDRKVGTDIFDEVFEFLYDRNTVLAETTLQLLFRYGTTLSIEKVFDQQGLEDYRSSIALASPSIYFKIRNTTSIDDIIDAIDKDLVMEDSALYMLIDDLPYDKLSSVLKKLLKRNRVNPIISILSKDIDLSENDYEAVRICLEERNIVISEHMLLHSTINTFYHGTNIAILMLYDIDAIKILHQTGTLINYNRVVSNICNKRIREAKDLLLQILDIFGYPQITDSSILSFQFYVDNGTFPLLLKHTYDLNDDTIIDAMISNIDKTDRIIELISDPRFELLKVIDRLLLASSASMQSSSKILDIARDKYFYLLPKELFERCISISSSHQAEELATYLSLPVQTSVEAVD
jgi:hypothetical protein